jgi:FkbM family methyltransferase
MSSISNNFLKLIRKAQRVFGDEYAVKSYSQEGEDLILKRLFSRKPMGFYVDVGAHHPKRFSNTHIFYSTGWRGINIDALPGSMNVFNQYRPRDINLEIAISDKVEELTYYEFNDPALNGFSKELSNFREKNTGYQIISTKKMTAFPLVDILDQHLPKGQKIDFMTIDAEGWDLKVLQSNDWSKYQPSVVLVEIKNTVLEDMENNPLVRFLKGKGYLVYAKSVNTWFFYRDPLKGQVDDNKIYC